MFWFPTYPSQHSEPEPIRVSTATIRVILVFFGLKSYSWWKKYLLTGGGNKNFQKLPGKATPTWFESMCLNSI